MRDAEFGQQFVQHHFARVGIRLDHFEHRPDIVFHRQAAENRGFLRQITEAKPRAAYIGNIVTSIPPENLAGIRRHQACENIKARRFAGAVRAEQADDFAALQAQADVMHDGAAFVVFAEMLGDEALLLTGKGGGAPSLAPAGVRG